MFGLWKRKPPAPDEARPPWVQVRTHWERCGSVIGFGDYRLVSFDEGATWWSIGMDGGAVMPADPALLRQLAVGDAIVRLGRKHPRLTSMCAPDDRKVYEIGRRGRG